MMAIGWVANLVQRGLTSLDRIHHLLAQQASLPDLPDTAEPPLAHPSFSLRGLTFAYLPTLPPALRNVDLDTRPGHPRHHRPHRQRQVHPLPAAGPALSRGGRPAVLRRPGCQHPAAGLHPLPYRLCRPGTDPLFRHHRRQYRPRPAGGDRGGDRRGRQKRRHPRGHQQPAERLCHADRRARRQALRRPAPAPGPGQGPALRSAGADHRRRPLGRRCGHRA